MKTMLILIKGRKVRCRALKPGERRNPETDVWDSGRGIGPNFSKLQGRMGTSDSGIEQAYRPIVSKRTAKAVKREPKPAMIKKAACAMTAMVDRRMKHIFDTDVSHGSQYGLSGLAEWDARFEKVMRRFLGVTISYRKKK